MEKFFKENYRFPHQIFKTMEGMWEKQSDKEFPPGTSFSKFYDEHYKDWFRSNSIGLHYGMVSDRYRLYMYSIIVWMAQAVLKPFPAFPPDGFAGLIRHPFIVILPLFKNCG
jgi:hypothetical protein